MAFSIINHPCWGTPIYGTPPYTHTHNHTWVPGKGAHNHQKTSVYQEKMHFVFCIQCLDKPSNIIWLILCNLRSRNIISLVRLATIPGFVGKIPGPEHGCVASRSSFRNFAGGEVQVFQSTQFRIWQTAGNHHGRKKTRIKKLNMNSE